MNQEEEEPKSHGSYYPEPVHSDRADIVEQQLDSARTTTEIRAYLLGTRFYLSKEGKWSIEKVDDKKRLMTDEGVDAVLSSITPLLSPQVVLAYISAK